MPLNPDTLKPCKILYGRVFPNKITALGVEGFELSPRQDSLMRNDRGKNHIFVK
jgi:hypothetical protein